MDPATPGNNRHDPCPPPEPPESSSSGETRNSTHAEVDEADLRFARRYLQGRGGRQLLEQQLRRAEQSRSRGRATGDGDLTPRGSSSNLAAGLRPSQSTRSLPSLKYIPGTTTQGTPAYSSTPLVSYSFLQRAMASNTPNHSRTEVSPSSSPRLPSPPPFTEVQIGPASPTIEGPVNPAGDRGRQDDGAARRIRPGTKAADMAAGPPLVPLADVCTSKYVLNNH